MDAIRRELPAADLRAGAVSRNEMFWLLQNSTATLLFSRMESLSFSLGEALALSQRVFATPIPVHIEVAARIGRDPVWLEDSWERNHSCDLVSSEVGALASVDRRREVGAWIAVAESLGLSRKEARP